MKLVYCTDSFFPELGGIQDSIAALARSLAARGHRLLIVAPEASASDYRLAGITSTGILPAGPGRPAARERPAERDHHRSAGVRAARDRHARRADGRMQDASFKVYFWLNIAVKKGRNHL